jgi:hypothetical protein
MINEDSKEDLFMKIGHINNYNEATNNTNSKRNIGDFKVS